MFVIKVICYNRGKILISCHLGPKMGPHFVCNNREFVIPVIVETEFDYICIFLQLSFMNQCYWAGLPFGSFRNCLSERDFLFVENSDFFILKYFAFIETKCKFGLLLFYWTWQPWLQSIWLVSREWELNVKWPGQYCESDDCVCSSHHFPGIPNCKFHNGCDNFSCGPSLNQFN